VRARNRRGFRADLEAWKRILSLMRYRIASKTVCDPDYIQTSKGKSKSHGACLVTYVLARTSGLDNGGIRGASNSACSQHSYNGENFPTSFTRTYLACTMQMLTCFVTHTTFEKRLSASQAIDLGSMESGRFTLHALELQLRKESKSQIREARLHGCLG
jgi:hypothetical protein